MFQRAVYSTIRYQAHKMYLFFIVTGISKSLHDLGILHNRIIPACFVDPYQILIHHPSGTDIQMADFRITHLAIRQTDIFSTSQ